MCIDCSLLSRKASSLQLKNCYAEHQFVLCTSKMKDGWNDRNIGEFDHIAPTSIVWSFCGKIVLLKLLP